MSYKSLLQYIGRHITLTDKESELLQSLTRIFNQFYFMLANHIRKWITIRPENIFNGLFHMPGQGPKTCDSEEV
ncbi:hypothetical protein SAMN05443144_105168 [Fodinibius roseus]|uniref:Uncharacterized protein n=1 Tax=Fodinibius roseus TaxID=1194090 RepID=A0A1M4YVF0_9BACT|nr:hypothetical protein SAMN05443144_105168 [Fodinibius roseus]